MGYWAKDGSYQYDESDIQLREAMNETQGQRYDRLNRNISNKPLFTEKEQEQREAYEAAKKRFKKLSPMKKMWLNLVGKGIGSYHPQNGVETLDSLYRGRSK